MTMFKGLFAALRALFAGPHEHEWRYESLCYDPIIRYYWMDRRCKKCGRHERRPHVRGAQSGDAVEIVPDAFVPWARVKENR
jgi:hypothetical protein